MNALIPLGPALPGAITTAEIDATEKALATRAAYASDWRDFAAWCASRGATALGGWKAKVPVARTQSNPTRARLERRVPCFTV
jgi:hypothetical protein